MRESIQSLLGRLVRRFEIVGDLVDRLTDTRVAMPHHLEYAAGILLEKRCEVNYFIRNLGTLINVEMFEGDPVWRALNLPVFPRVEVVQSPRCHSALHMGKLSHGY